MNRLLKKSMLLSGALIFASTAIAQSSDKPVFQVFNFDDGSIVQNISNNGKWAVACGTNSANTTWSFYPKLIDLSKTTDNVIEILTSEELAGSINAASAYDVTDDGNIVVGDYEGFPAIYHVDTKTWEKLPVPNAPHGEDWNGGIVSAVTPDGKWAVGKMSAKSYFYEEPVLWSLEDAPSIVETNWPMEDMSGNWQEQTRFTGISADGKKIVGCVSYSYPDHVMYFIYDVDSATWKPVGFDIIDGEWIPKAEGIHHANDIVLSPSGKYATGSLYMVKFEDGAEFGNQYIIPYRYDLENDLIEIYDGIEDTGMKGGAVSDDGIIYASTPGEGSPVRDWHARVNNYWYSFDSILKQIYNIEYVGATGYENTGTMWAVSGDGLKFCSFTYPIGESYIVEMPQTIAEIAPKINLLKSYSVTPVEGAVLSTINSLSITFDRYVEVIGEKNSVYIADEEGNVIKNSISFKSASESSKTINIGFREAVLENGKTYSVIIPEGSIRIFGDDTQKNKEIAIKYTGRENTAVKMTSVSPSDGSSVSLINLTTNPIIVTFDANLLLSESATTTPMAHLYLSDEGTGDELVADMYVLASNNQVLIYPVSEQRLFEGSTYTIVVDKGAVTDLSGANANEEFSFVYKGSYVREINPGESALFSENFSNGLSNMMLYEGDHNVPTDEMIAIDFLDADNYPWSLATDESYDMAASSHSLYTNGGKSDDWMVIPQLYIDNERCVLSFDAQSYKAKEDHIKVLIWENDEVINTLTSSNIEEFRNNAKLELDEILLPGASEENLAGEWTHYAVDLAKYSGKNIYIAFYNDNQNQSVIFLDNVEVKRNMDFIVSLETNSVVVDQEEVAVKGRLKIENETETYSEITATLIDSDGNEIDKLTETGLELSYGDIYAFEFSKKLPVAVGKTLKYTVNIILNETEYDAVGEIKNLYFKPTKRVVVEKMTGQGCGNCPLGIIMFDKLHETYGDLFIPISIHAYTGDSFGVGIIGSYAEALGMIAAPTGIVNRNGHISSPMISTTDGSSRVFSYTNESDPLWWDDVATEFATLAEADITINGAQYDQDAKTIKIPVEYKFAVDSEGLNINLFGVILENNLRGSQSNYFSSETDPLLGEWREGGIYGNSVVRNYYFDHVARGVYGITFNGTGGLVESNVTAGEVYSVTLDMAIPETVKEISNCDAVVMMIDANTGKVINAACDKIYDVLSVENLTEDNIIINTENGLVFINGNNVVNASLYSVDGTLIDSATGDNFTLESNGYSGIGIVRVVTETGVIVKKIMIE